MTKPKPHNHYAVKAVLLSALVFPGLGLWWLKHRLRACIFILPAGISLGFMLKTFGLIYTQSMNQLRAEGENILLYDLQGLIAHLYKIITHNMATLGASLHSYEMIFIAAWICGMVSSYFVGQQRDQALRTKMETMENAQ